MVPLHVQDVVRLLLAQAAGSDLLVRKRRDPRSGRAEEGGVDRQHASNGRQGRAPSPQEGRLRPLTPLLSFRGRRKTGAAALNVKGTRLRHDVSFYWLHLRWLIGYRWRKCK